MDTSNILRGERPIYGTTANSKDAILIPKLKSSSLKRAVRLPVTLSSKNDGMRDLIRVHILDQAAAALALSYIEKFELELITLRHRVVELENFTSIQKYQDVTSANSFPNFGNLNEPNDATMIPLCESKSPSMASSFINQPAYACDDFLENVPPQTNEACLTKVVISATKTTLNCINPDAPLVRRSNRRASMSKSFTYPTPTKERSISEKTAQIQLKEGKSSVKVLENKTSSTAGTVFGNMAYRHQELSLNVSESIVTEVKKLQKSPVASITNNARTIIDSTGKEIFSFDYLRNDDEVNLNSLAVWASPGLIQDPDIPQSDPRERCDGARDNLVECADYSTAVHLEGGISPPATIVWQQSNEQSPEKDVGIMDYENAEAYGVLMFDSAVNNGSSIPLDQESPGGKFNSEYASEVSMDDLLAHEDVFSSLAIVESNTSTTARRTSGRFCVKPKRYLNDIIHNKKTKGPPCQKKTEAADLKKTSIQQEKAGNPRLSFQLLRGEGYASGDNLLTNPDRNDHGNLTSMGVEPEVMCDNVNVTPQKRHYVDNEYTAVVRSVLKLDQEHSIDQYKQSTMAFLRYDTPSTSHMKSEEEQNWQQYVDFRDQDYEENCGVMSWGCDTDIDTSKVVCSSSSSKICSAGVTTNQKISKDSAASLGDLALLPSSQPTIYQRLCVVEKFIQSESTDELLRGATATSALRSARQIFLDSPCYLSESNLKSTGMAFVTIFYSFISASAVASSIFLPQDLIDSILGIVKYFDCSIEETETTNNEMNSLTGKKSVRFCDVDGSSVTPPGKDCCHLPILRTMRRLHGLIGKIEIIVKTVQATHQITEDPSADNLSPVLDLLLQCCVQLTDTVSAAAASRAVRESMLLSIPPGEVAALAGLIGSEIIATMKARSSSSLSGARTILRHRTAWMSTSVLRSQLRWLLDAPPAFVSVQSICHSDPINLSRRSLLHKMVSLCEGGDALSVTSSSKKKRRKSDITVIDHTTLHPVEMTLSSLLAHALRQIYDAITIVVDSSAEASQSVDTGYTDIVAAEFLTAAVTHQEGVNQVNAALDGMEHSHPQVIIKDTLFFIVTRFVCSCSFLIVLSISHPCLHMICLNYQLALAAIRANAFIRHLLTFPAVRECIAGEVAIWSVMSECASLISEHGMSEDRHLCLFAGGYEGLLRFSHCRLMSDEAEAVCTRHVSSLMNSNSSFDHGCKTDANDLTMLLNESFIYDFPRLTAILKVA